MAKYRNEDEKRAARNERRRDRYTEKIWKPAEQDRLIRQKAWAEHHVRLPYDRDNLHTDYMKAMDSIPKAEKTWTTKTKAKTQDQFEDKISRNLNRDVDAVVKKHERKHHKGFIDADTSGSECFSDLYFDGSTQTATMTFRRDGYVLDESMTKEEFLDWLTQADPDGDGLGVAWNAS